MRFGKLQRREKERGSVLVEFALIFPILVMLLVGTISGGFLYDEKLSLSYAAREGARYGSTHDRTDPLWAASVANVVVQRATGSLTADQVCVALVSGYGGSEVVYSSSPQPGDYSTAPSNGPCIAGDGSGTDDELRVQVTVNKAATLEAVAFTMPVALRSSAVGKFEA